MNTRVDVQSDGVEAALKKLRRDIDRDIKRVLNDAVEKHAVPLANAYAPSISRGHIVAKATTRQVYLTLRNGLSRVERARDALLEFGGVINTEITPKKAKALRLADGSFRMIVKRPRRIKAKAYIRRAADRSRPQVGRAVGRDLGRVLQDRIDAA